MLKIFIADDDLIIRRGLRVIIEKKTKDCVVVGEAQNGIDALEAIEKLMPDILITDIKMPGMNGVELVKKIKEKGINIKIIILSGFDEYSFVRETLKSGAVDYLLKPIENDVLTELLKKIKTDIEYEEEKNENLELLNEKAMMGMEVLRQKYLKELIRDSNYKNTEALGIKDFKEFVIAVISIDDYYKIVKHNQDFSNTPFHNITESVAKSIWENNGITKDYYLIFNGREVIILLLSHCVIGEEFMKYVINSLEQIRLLLEAKREFTITTGISCLYSKLELINSAYREANIAIERRFFDKKNKVYIYDAINWNYSDNNDYSSFTGSGFDDLINYFEIADSNKAKKCIVNILEKKDIEKISPEKIKIFIKDIFIKVSSIVNDFNQVLQSINEDEFDVFYYIDEINTKTELCDYISEVVFNICEKMKLMRSERSKKTIEMVKLYIQMHFKENISLKSVAEHVHMNYTYLSEFFKKETGINFMDYLIEVRINEAKILLKNPINKIYEIGNMVGYEEPASFNRVFKKIVGLTPAEYRKVIK